MRADELSVFCAAVHSGLKQASFKDYAPLGVLGGGAAGGALGTVGGLAGERMRRLEEGEHRNYRQAAARGARRGAGSGALLGLGLSAVVSKQEEAARQALRVANTDEFLALRASADTTLGSPAFREASRALDKATARTARARQGVASQVRENKATLLIVPGLAGAVEGFRRPREEERSGDEEKTA